jgi:nicotinamidase-related amidase
MKCAVVVVDMLNDFVTGKLTCDRAIAIVPHVKKLLTEARNHNIPVIFSNDEHIENIVEELKL